jgi:voltage-gated potassium channel
MVLLVIVVLTSSTLAVLEFETDVPGGNIRSGADAIWWAVVTMATVGYGDYFPVTPWGRAAAVALMTVGIGIFGVLASYLANFFLPTRDSAGDSEDLAGIQADLAALDERLQAIEAALRDLARQRPGDEDSA